MSYIYNMYAKRLFCILLSALTLVDCRAQDTGVRTFELEPMAGITYPLSSDHGHDRSPDASIGLEARWNLRHSPLDVGVQFYLGNALYIRHLDDGKTNEINRGTMAFLMVADYNRHRGRMVSSFVGIGIGVQQYDVLVNSLGDGPAEDDGWGVGLVPRAGVELWRHWRVTLNAHIGKRRYHTVELTVGYAFGGGLRKRP